MAAALALAAAGCAHGKEVPTRETSFHTVQPGETLYRIAKSYGVSVIDLKRENALDDAARVHAGMRLYIPPPHQPKAESRKSKADLAWPVRGVLFSPFGPRARDRHDGIDLAAPEGSPIVAAEGGTVLFAGRQRGYGNLILLGHGGDLVTVYAHNRENLVAAGQRVARGALIARVGHTGRATGPHLHFEVRVSARPRDPLQFLR